MAVLRRLDAISAMALLFALVLGGICVARAQNSEGGRCTNPQQRQGTCIPIDSCDSLRQMIQQRPLPPETVDFLRRSQCGFSGNRPLVCCPSSGGGGNGGGGGRPNTAELFGLNGGGNSNTGGGGGTTTSTGNLENHPNIGLLRRDTCGVDFSERIVGGEEAKIKEYPWLALLQYQTNRGRQFLCGGALINDKYILTAAHCVKGIGNTRLVGIRLGEHNIDTDPDCQPTDDGQICANPVQDFNIAEVIAHPQYRPESRDKLHDIALIRLDRVAPSSDSILPICLPAGQALTKRYDGNRLIVAGWGKTENSSSSNVKLWVQIPVMTNAACAPIYQRQLTLNANQMCAGGVKGKDSCRGDSGGPLMSAENVVRSRPGAQYVVAGIVSIGPAVCGAEGRPGIYTRVGPYVNWILDNLKA